MTKKFTASDCMVKKLVTIRPEARVEEAISILLKHRISGMPVMDGDGNLVGIVSERDCLETFVSGSYHNAPSSLVREVMSTDIKSVSPSTDILKIAELFVKSKFRRLPVIEDSELVGQISRRDVLKAIEQMN